MIIRRNYLIGAGAALIGAPAVARAETLMKIRGVILPVKRNYYGFVDRLWINHRYRSGELRGDSLTRLVGEGVLSHIPSKDLAYDIARWGIQPLSLVVRQERAKFFNRLPPVFPSKS